MGCLRWLAVAVVVAIVAFVGKLVDDLGVLRTITPHDEDACVVLHGVSGAEDLLLADDHIYFGSDDRSWMKLEGLWGNNVTKQIASQAAQGDIYAIPTSALKDAKAGDRPWKVVPLVDSSLVDFHPHGIGAVEDKLFVVNHRRDGDFIEVFDRSPDGLKYLASLSSSLFRNLNDVYAVSSTEFYATNWLYYSPGTLKSAVEIYGQMAWCDVIHCTLSSPTTIKQCKVVLDKMAMPNGIAGDTAANTVFVAETINKRVQKYKRSADGSLSLLQSFPVNSNVDNVDFADGKVYVGTHPSAFKFLRHAKNHSRPSPSQVVRINDDGSVEELYMSHGHELAGLSGAVPVHSLGLFVGGAVHNDGILVCKLKDKYPPI